MVHFITIALSYSPIAQLVERLAVHEVRSTECKGVVHKGQSPRQNASGQRREVALVKRERRRYADRQQYLIAAVHKRRKKIREMAIEYKGGACERCGYDSCAEALDFHHTNSSDKDFSISSKGYTRSWKRVKEELDKCLLLCANCHRELHARVSSFHGKPWLKKRVNSGKPYMGNPEPSPKREGAETRHSLPKSEKDTVKV